MLNENGEEMGNFRNYLVLILWVIISTFTFQAQENVNRETVEQIYESLQTRGHGAKDVAGLSQGMDWKKLGASNSVDHRNTISFPAVMENRWGSLKFRDLVFEEMNKDEIRVTGTVSGRQPMECEHIAHKFSHSWSFRKGKIVGFLEEF
jgi:hypothetical protein